MVTLKNELPVVVVMRDEYRLLWLVSSEAVSSRLRLVWVFENWKAMHEEKTSTALAEINSSR